MKIKLVLMVLGLLMATMCASAQEDIDVLKAKTEMLSYLTAENCTMDDELRVQLGLSVGDQFLLTRQSATSKYGLVTIHSDYEDGSDNDDIRMRYTGRERFDTTDSFAAWAEAWTPIHGQTDAWLNSNDEMGEFLEETSTTHTEVVFTAPHGGMIENYTDEMAQWAYDYMDTNSKSASAWYCIGHQDAIGAYNAWHITSSDISRNSFPYLDDIGDRGFDYAVSFHGYSESDIGVGGRAPSALKTEVKEAIEDAVGTAYDVVILTSGPYAGTSTDNFVNWLTSTGDDGVQIELPYAARRDYGQDIAEAVAAVFAAKQ